MVEADERVRDDEEALREVGPVCRQPDGRLQPRDMVVAEVADHGRASLDRALGVLERDQPGARAEQAVAAEASLLDRLEQEARLVAAQAQIRAERRDQIGRDVGGGLQHG